MLMKAWDRVDNNVIANCFRHVQFAPENAALETTSVTEHFSDVDEDNLWERLQRAGCIPTDFQFSDYKPMPLWIMMFNHAKL